MIIKIPQNVGTSYFNNFLNFKKYCHTVYAFKKCYLFHGSTSYIQINFN